MKIEFESVKIENFFSLGNVELDLSDRGYTLISGINKNPADNAKSNGSGKSSAFNAIVWCLTGETIQGISSNIINIHANDGCKVELNFLVNNDVYKIIRSRDHSIYGTNLKIFINDEDKSGKGLRDTEQLLKQYLPDLTSDLLGAVIVLGQGLPQRFTNNTPSGRKEVLEKLAKSDFMIDDIKDRLTERQSLLNSKLREYDDSTLSAKAKIDSLSNILQHSEESLAQIKDEKDYDDIIKIASENLALIEEKIQNVSSIYNDQSENFSRISQEKNSKELEKQRKKLNITEAFNNSINELKFQLLTKDNEIKSVKDTINRLNAITDICPTCGQKIPGIYKPDTSKETAALIELTNCYDELTEKLKQLENTKNIELNTVEEDSHKTLISYSNTLANLTSNLQENRQTIDRLNLDKRSVEKTLLNAQIDKQNSQKTKEEFKKQIDSLQHQINDLNNIILYNNNERIETQNRLDVVNKMLTIAKRDFRGYLLLNVINFIDQKAKEYCRDIFNNDKIKFELDKNNILITYDSKPYENLSGGEKQKIDIIIQFSIRDMLCQFSAFSSNIIVLDELFDSVDAIGCERIINLLTTKLNDIDSIFIITHHNDIPISADSVISIIKNEQGISSIS